MGCKGCKQAREAFKKELKANNQFASNSQEDMRRLNYVIKQRDKYKQRLKKGNITKEEYNALYIALFKSEEEGDKNEES